MLRNSKGARRLNDLITLTRTQAVVDEFGHASFGAPVAVLDVYASVRQISSSKTMLTYQQGNVVGLEIEMRVPGVEYNGIRWRGHDVHFATPEIVDNRGRMVKISGWYSVDAPEQSRV